MTTIIAIDFGTSNTIICTLDPVTQTPRSLKFNRISRKFEGTEIVTVPTLVFVEKDNHLIFGEEVRSQRRAIAEPQRYFHSFKRDLVADYQPPPRKIDEQIYSAKLISESFLKHIWQSLAEQYISPTRVVFTVPVGSFERYLDWFRDFATELNVEEVQIVDESTAAALGYAVNKIGALVLVIDFGGGTLDLSLVRTREGEQKIMRAEVLAKSDAYVGGIDVDTWIVEHYLAKINSNRQEIQEIGWLNLLELAERLKIRLSTVPQATESWFDDLQFMAYDLTLDREELALILESRQLLQQIRDALDEVLSIALTKAIKKADIEQVLLVGGSCLIPAVQQLIVSYFGPAKVKLDKPFEAVAHGALSLSQMVTVEDYLRHGYVIRLWDPANNYHIYHPLFKAGTKYPCHKPEPLILQVAEDKQKEILLDIGEVSETSQAEVHFDVNGKMTTSQLQRDTNYRSLESQHQAVCIAHLDPPGQVGKDRISVHFEVDSTRVLLATVKDLLTGKVLVDRGAIVKFT